MLVKCRVAIAVFFVCAFAAAPAFTQILPNAADSARIGTQQMPVRPEVSLAKPQTSGLSPVARSMTLKQRSATTMLSSFTIEGMTVFSQSDFTEMFQPYLGRTVTAEQIWMMAGQVTERYRNGGYFLSQAEVKQISGGHVIISVSEGYIGEVELKGDIAKHFVVKQWIERIKSKRPVAVNDIENMLLQLNNLSGVALRAVLEPMPNLKQKNAAVKLSLLPQKERDKMSITFNNAGSRYLGPYQGIANYEGSILPLQKTSLTWLNSVPTRELSYGAIAHTIPVFAGVDVEFSGSRTRATPGFRLVSQDIESDSEAFGFAVLYRAFHLRKEQLKFRAAIDGRNTKSNIVGTPLTRDKVRVASVGAAYELADIFGGLNALQTTFSQGLSGLGASEAGELNLSRQEAEPDFRKVEASYVRIQALSEQFETVVTFSGQAASAPLFSSEEFGYGGQSFGRAYDNSEITGDHGASASIELRYKALPVWHEVKAVPYVFYDGGAVWNDDSNDEGRQSGTSAGFGARFEVPYQVQADVGLAYPLTRSQEAPLSGNGNSPRLIMQISKAF